MIVGEGGLKLQCLWKLRDYQCGVELINRVYKVTEAAGHFPNLHLEQPNQVRAELWTSSIGKTSYKISEIFIEPLATLLVNDTTNFIVAGGLTLNDFIVAAKIDEIKTSDLVPRRRAWA